MTTKFKKILLGTSLTLAAAAVTVGVAVPLTINHATTKNSTVDSGLSSPSTSSSKVTKSIVNNSTYSMNDGDTVMAATVTSSGTADTVYQNTKDDLITALISSTDNVTFSTKLNNNSSNIKDVTYQWYNAGTETKISADTSSTISISSDSFSGSDASVLAYYAIISFKINNIAYSVKTGDYAATNVSVTTNETINNNTNTPTVINNSTTATLGLTASSSSDISNLAYSFANATTSSTLSGLSWTTSAASGQYDLTDLSGLNVYYGKVNFTFDNYEFSTTTSPYVLSAINSSMLVNDSSYGPLTGDLANDANYEATLTISNLPTSASVKWYVGSSAPVDTGTPKSTTDSYTLPSDMVSSTTNLAYVTASVNYTEGGYSFSYNLTQAFTNIGVTDSGING